MTRETDIMDVCQTLALAAHTSDLQALAQEFYGRGLHVCVGYDPAAKDWKKTSPFLAFTPFSEGGDANRPGSDDGAHHENVLLVMAGTYDESTSEPEPGIVVLNGLRFLSMLWKNMRTGILPTLPRVLPRCTFSAPDVRYSLERFPLITAHAAITITQQYAIGDR